MPMACCPIQLKMLKELCCTIIAMVEYVGLPIATEHFLHCSKPIPCIANGGGHKLKLSS